MGFGEVFTTDPYVGRFAEKPRLGTSEIDMKWLKKVIKQFFADMAAYYEKCQTPW